MNFYTSLLNADGDLEYGPITIKGIPKGATEDELKAIVKKETDRMMSELWQKMREAPLEPLPPLLMSPENYRRWKAYIAEMNQSSQSEQACQHDWVVHPDSADSAKHVLCPVCKCWVER